MAADDGIIRADVDVEGNLKGVHFEDLPPDHPMLKRVIRGISKEDAALVDNTAAFPLISIIHDNDGKIPTRRLIRDNVNIGFTDGSIRKNDLRQWIGFCEEHGYIKRVEKPEGVFHVSTPKGKKMADIMHRLNGKERVLSRQNKEGTVDLLPVDIDEVDILERDGKHYAYFRPRGNLDNATKALVTGKGFEQLGEELGLEHEEAVTVLKGLSGTVDEFLKRKLTMEQVKDIVRKILNEFREERMAEWIAAGKTPPKSLTDPQSIEELVDSWETQMMPTLVANRSKDTLGKMLKLFEDKGDNHILYFKPEDMERAEYLCRAGSDRKLTPAELVELGLLALDGEANEERMGVEFNKPTELEKMAATTQIQNIIQEQLKGKEKEIPENPKVEYDEETGEIEITEMSAKERYLRFLETIPVQDESRRVRVIQDFLEDYPRLAQDVENRIRQGEQTESIVKKTRLQYAPSYGYNIIPQLQDKYNIEMNQLLRGIIKEKQDEIYRYYYNDKGSDNLEGWELVDEMELADLIKNRIQLQKNGSPLNPTEETRIADMMIRRYKWFSAHPRAKDIIWQQLVTNGVSRWNDRANWEEYNTRCEETAVKLLQEEEKKPVGNAKEQYIHYLENRPMPDEKGRIMLIQKFIDIYPRIQRLLTGYLQEGQTLDQIREKLEPVLNPGGDYYLSTGNDNQDIQAMRQFVEGMIAEIKPTITMPTPLPPKERELTQQELDDLQKKYPNIQIRKIEEVEEGEAQADKLRQQVNDGTFEVKTPEDAIKKALVVATEAEADKLTREQHLQNMQDRGAIRREMILELLKRGKKTREIALELNTSTAVIFNETSEIAKEARARLDQWIEQQLPIQMGIILNNLREVADKAMQASRKEHLTEEERLEALSLAQQTNLRILQVMTNPRMFANAVLRNKYGKGSEDEDVSD